MENSARSRPLTTRSGIAGSATPSMVNVTIPVGAVAAAAVAATVAVNVTIVPTFVGSVEETTTVEVATGLLDWVGAITVWVRGVATVLPLKVESPLYAAVTVCVPADKVE